MAVVTDASSPLTIAAQNGGRVVIFCDLVEDLILQEAGLSYDTANLQGRLIRQTPVFCRDCGRMYHAQRLFTSVGRTGCLIILALSAATGTALGWLNQSVWVGGFAMWLSLSIVLALTDFTINRLIRRRFRDRVQEFERAPECPKCHSKRYVSLQRLWIWGRIPCQECGKNAVQIQIIGKS